MKYTVEYSDYIICSGVAYTTIIDSGDTDEFFTAQEYWESVKDEYPIERGHQAIVIVRFFDNDKLIEKDITIFG